MLQEYATDPSTARDNVLLLVEFATYGRRLGVWDSGIGS